MELIQMPTGGNIIGHKDEKEIITRYNVETNEVVKGRPDRGIYTLFKPDDGIEYYNRKKKGDVERGGKE